MVASDILPPSNADKCRDATCGSSVFSTSTTARSPNFSAVSLMASSACLVEPARTSSVTCCRIAGSLVLSDIVVSARIEQMRYIFSLRDFFFVILNLVFLVFLFLQGLERMVFIRPALRILEQESGNDRLACQFRIGCKHSGQSIAGFDVAARYHLQYSRGIALVIVAALRQQTRRIIKHQVIGQGKAQQVHIADFKAVGKFADQRIDNPLIVPSVGRLAQGVLDLDTQFARLIHKFRMDAFHNISSSKKLMWC